MALALVFLSLRWISHLDQFDFVAALYRKPYPWSSESHMHKVIQKSSFGGQKREHGAERERDWGCSAETDGEIACRNIALCGSQATLQTRFGFRRQSDSSSVRSSNRPPHWRLNALLSSIPSLREWLLELIMQNILYRANSCGFKIRLDEARFLPIMLSLHIN